MTAPPWMRFLVPSLSDLLFIALLMWLLVFTNTGSPLGLLQDAGTGVHIRTGEWILDHHEVPMNDLFSFSKPGEKWFAWEWLSDVVFAIFFRIWGLKGPVLMSAAIIAFICWFVVRHMALRGANALAALVVMHAMIAAASVHFLARPHIFTLLFFALSFYWIDEDRRSESRRLWILVPLTAIWANMHGGFSAIILTLVALAGGSVLEQDWPKALRYGRIAAASVAVSIVNPYGYRLHLHVIDFLHGGWIRKIIIEFQPPRLDTASGIYFEVLLFLGIALAGRLAYQKRFAEAAVMLMWAHAGLLSIRHVPIFVILAAPYIAREVTELMRQMQGEPKSMWSILNQLGEEHLPGLMCSSLVVPAMLIALFAFDCGFTYPTDFPEVKYPVGVLGSPHAGLLKTTRLYTSDAWGDYLIYRNYPNQKVFFDGRTDYYGEALTHDYEILLNGFAGWEGILGKYNIETILTPPEGALSGLMRERPGWECWKRMTPTYSLPRLASRL